MRHNLELVARPEEVLEDFMDKALVCRTDPEIEAVAPVAPAQLANPTQGAHLYFIKIAKGRSPVKIGRANDPQVRLKTLQVASPYALKLLGVLEGCGDAECDFHLFLSESRMRGEWFSWSKLVEETVALALSGGDWRAAIAQPEFASIEEDDWRIGSPLYAGNPKYPQYQARD